MKLFNRLAGHSGRIVFFGRMTLLLLAASPVMHAATITGTVTNKTTNRPDANDDVVLVGLTQNMQEVARTKTNASGHYSINLPDAGMHLIRVDHQKAAYFAAVPPGKTQVDVTVYDVAPVVQGVTTEAVMVRIEADEQGLHVIESYFVKNDSKPARTQFGPNAYEIYLPTDAQLEASIAMGPGGMPVSSPPVPSGEKGHYSFIFPVRPGETRFQVSYHTPYSGSRSFQPRVSLPTGNYAIVLPKSMAFTAGAGTSFEPMNGDAGTQSLLARNISPSQSLSFTITGKGSLPRDTPAEQNAGDQASGSSSPDAADNRPGGGMAAPINTPDPLDKYKWWIISGIALILAIAAAFFLRSAPQQPILNGNTATSAPSNSAQPPQSFWLASLKEELFALETERLEGKLSESEYQEQKSAFEIVLKRALKRHAQLPPKA